MKRFLIPGAALAASLALAACGGGGGGSSASSSGMSGTVGVKSIGDTGKVLVDASGKALYASNVEADGSVKCVDACESFWKPFTLGSGTPKAASSGVGKLATIKRPDGTRQVTADGKLLYTFVQDGPGDLKGNGFSDDFQGKHFVWNAVLEGGKLASSSGSGSDSGSGSGGNDAGGYPQGSDYGYR